VGIGGKANEGVSGVINQTGRKHRLCRVSLRSGAEPQLRCGEKQGGNFIQPCVATITAGTQGLAYPPDLRVSLTDGPDPNAYPITGTTYALVYQNQTDAAKAKATGQLLLLDPFQRSGRCCQRQLRAVARSCRVWQWG